MFSDISPTFFILLGNMQIITCAIIASRRGNKHITRGISLGNVQLQGCAMKGQKHNCTSYFITLLTAQKG